MKKITLFLCMCIAHPLSASDRERLEVDGTVIKGNRESPKSLFVVPWKSPPPSSAFKLRNSPSGIPSGPIRRDELLREIQYFDVLHGDKPPFPID